MKRTFFITTLITLIFIAPAQADKWALLVGINNYEHPEVIDLQYAVADVKAFKKALEDVGGFKSDKIILMTDESRREKRPANTNILFQVESLAGRINPQDTFIFYFSGHGIMRKGRAFLMSINVDPRSLGTLELSGVPMEKLRENLSKLNARQILFIIDACRNDPGRGKGGKDNLLTDDFAKGIRVKPRAADSGLPSATATLYACSKGERAYEYYDKQQGAFSYFLVEGLRGKAADSDGNITVNGLAYHTQKEVAKWGKASKKKQTPWLVQEGAGKIILARADQGDVVEVKTTARLEVSSNPAGARIYIDDTFYGETPKTIECDLGRLKEKEIEIALELSGHKTKVLKRTVRRSGKYRLPKINLPRKQKPVPPPKPQPNPTRIRQKDGAKMILIPAGEFKMGSNDGSDDEKPVHTVYLDAYYIDACEVTNAQYRKFVEATGHREPEGYGYVNGKWQEGFKPWSDRNFNNPNQPVVCVSWEDAKAYAEWAGASLPTEAQWEKAARGDLVGKKYVWGDEFPPSALVGNFADESAKRVFTNWAVIEGYDDGYAHTAPVGSFPANGYGLFDMAGNVWEWCLDAYEKDYYSRSPKRNPVNNNLTNVNSRVLRGGPWSSSNPDYLRCACRLRFERTFRFATLGFRCCVVPAED